MSCKSIHHHHYSSKCLQTTCFSCFVKGQTMIFKLPHPCSGTQAHNRPGLVCCLSLSADWSAPLIPLIVNADSRLFCLLRPKFSVLQVRSNPNKRRTERQRRTSTKETKRDRERRERVQMKRGEKEPRKKGEKKVENTEKEQRKRYHDKGSKAFK